MKSLKVFTLILFSISIGSCSSDDSSTNENTSPIVGNWIAVNAYDEFSDGSSEPVNADGSSIEFTSNGNFNSHTSVGGTTVDSEGSYSISESEDQLLMTISGSTYV